MRSNKIALLALVVGTVALWLAWQDSHRRLRPLLRPGSAFFAAPPDAEINASDELSQETPEPAFYAAPPSFTADISPDGTRRFQHEAGW